MRPGPKSFHSARPFGLAHATWATARAGGRLVLFAVANVGLAALYFLLLPTTLGSPSRRAHLRNRIFRIWGRLSLACAGVRLRVIGSPPQGPCFLVANHVVYADIWVLASLTGAVFVAESGIASWPFFGAMARALSIIFVDRLNNRTIPGVNRRMEEALRRGHVVVLFPEGRTSMGKELLSFRSSLLEPAASGELPVAWASIEYRTGPDDPPASQVVTWPDGMRLAAHASKFLRLDRVDAQITFGAEPVRLADRKALAAELQRRIESIHAPMT